MTINELLAQVDTKNAIQQENQITITNLGDTFNNQDIVIDTISLNVKSKKGTLLLPNTKIGIHFVNCSFKSIDLCSNIGLQHFSCDNVTVNELLIKKQKLTRLSIQGTFNNLKINNSEINLLDIQSKNDIDMIDVEKSKVKSIEVRVTYARVIKFHKLVECDQLIILPNLLTGQNKVAVVDYFSMNFCSKIKHIYISMLHTPLQIKNLHISDFNDIEKLEINNITVDTATILSRTSYNDIKASFSNIQINKFLSMNNIDFGKSVFKNLNLSKCLFNNSLISKSLFYECTLEKIPDIPLEKFNKVALALIFPIVIIITISNQFTGLWAKELLYVFTLVLPYIFAFLMISLFLFYYKHSATLDEKCEKNRNLIDDLFRNVQCDGKSLMISFKHFIWKVDEAELLRLKEVENINRQLKVAFEASKDSQNANEFVYSEMLMKIRQKNIWMNLVSVDFWNYLINGFGRRWRRALMNFFIVFSLSVFLFMGSAPFQFKVQENAPQFIHESNNILLEAIPQEALDKGFFTLFNIENNTTENNTTQKPKKVTDGTPILTSIVGLSSVYTLSKIDIFKVKTNRWLEETSFWNFFKSNVISVVLLFLFGSFILAFKRRLDK